MSHLALPLPILSLFAVALLAATLVALAVWDVACRRLPDWLTLPLLVQATVWSLSLGHPAALLGGTLWAGLYLAMAVARGGLGGGDVKLAAGLGTLVALVDLQWVFLASLLASLFAVGHALAVSAFAASSKEGARGSVFLAHGPHMIAAAGVVVLAGAYA